MVRLKWCVVWALVCGVTIWPIPSLCAATPGIQLESVLVDWTTSLEEVDTTVCFRDGQVTDVSGASQYQLVLTTEEGGEWRQQGASRTVDHQWCFPSVTLPKEDVSKTLSILVTLKDIDLKTVLASGDTEVFPIVPIVEAVRPDVWVISWKNPGADTFTLRREDHPHPLATGLTGQTCSYFLFLQEEDEGVFTIEMNDSSAVHQLARLVINSSATDLLDLATTKVQILEIRQVLSGRDTLGEDQNTVVVIEPEEDIDVLYWELRQQHRDPNYGPTYTLIVNDTYQKGSTAGIEFEDNLVESSYIFLVAFSDSNIVIAIGIAAINVTYLGTRVSWVQREGVAGFLRIETGTLKEVTAGILTCQSTDSPCYLYSTGWQVPLEVPRCEDLMDTYNNATIKHCDDVIGTSNNLTDTPKLVLYQEENSLEVSYSDEATQVEVVVINPTDNIVFDNQIQCTGEDNQCSVVITDGLQSSQVTILVVLLDQDGYAVMSASVPFDVYKVSARQVLQDVVEVTWTYSISGTYHLVFNSSSSPELQVTVACTNPQNNESCQGHLIRVGMEEKVSISVSKQMTENNIVVTNNISGVLAPEGQVNKVTRMVDSSGTRVSIATTEAPIIQVTLVKFWEDTANSSSLTAGYFVGEVKETAEGYLFKFTDDILKQEKSVDLLCLGYKDDGSIGVAAAVYLTLTELKEKLTWVGAESSNSSASVRSDTLLQEGSINGTRVCLQDEPPCYYVQVGGEEAWKVLRCEQVNNTAPGGPATVSQCDDNLAAFKETSQALTVSMVGGSVEVTLSTSTTATIEVVVYDPANPDKIYSNTDLPCTTNDQDKRRCLQSMKATQAGQRLSVLVVLVDQSTGSTVLESTLLSLQVPDESSKTPAWVIVVSVLGSVFGAALIVFIAAVVYKKQQVRKSGGGGGTQMTGGGGGTQMTGGGGGSLQGSAHSTPIQRTAHDPYSAAHYSPQRIPPPRDLYIDTSFSPRRDVHDLYNDGRYSPGHSSHSSYQHAQSSVEPVVSYIPKASLKPRGTSSRFDSPQSSRHSDRSRY